MRGTSIIRKIRSCKSTLVGKYKVSSIFLFGSYARGDATKDSDVDLLVDFEGTVGLFEFIQLKEFLEQTLKRRVDLVTRDALKDWMRAQVEGEAIRAT